jgi:type VI secretion system FHA domain protein
MYLTLEVVSPQAVSLGAQRRRVVGQNGLTIGRGDGNDWIIPDQYVSKQHARIFFTNGAFFVEGFGRNPIAIANANNSLPSRQPHALKTGDHLFIDRYDIVITILQGDPPHIGLPVTTDDPFGIADADAGAPEHPPLVPDVWDSAMPGGVSDTAELDPLVALGSGSRPAVRELPPVNLQPDSPLRDPFAPPPPRVQAAPSPGAASGAIPASWDQSAPAARPTASGIPVNWDRSVLSPPPPPPGRPRGTDHGPQAALAPVPQGEMARRAPPPRSAPAPQPVRPPPPAAALRASVLAPAAPLPEVMPAVPVPGGLTELLRGAGLSERDLSPEVMRELGQVLRIVVQGVMDVLHARAEIKSQFRLPLTRVQAEENNPLKLSPNVESALHTLLVQRNPGYLATAQAFDEAFIDIRNHQMAVLEGVRVAFSSMLEAFDPEELQKEFDETVKRRGLLGRGARSAKSRYWDLYTERFARLGRDADETFRRLFGDVFAQAYERQLERLKSLAGRRDKN